MPVMSGMEATKQIRELGYTNPILGVVFIFVAYELLRRSAAVYKAQPMMKHSPTERKKTQENRRKPKIIRYPSETWYVRVTAA